MKLNWAECIVRKVQKQKAQFGDTFSIFQFVVFVSFEMFTIHVLRNCYEKTE